MNIRTAQKSDIPAILSLIHDLAIYEKEPDAVMTTEEDLLRDGFSDKPKFHCLIGEINDEVQGMALYFYTWSTWEGCCTLYLEDLYVRSEARGQGLGLKLFKTLAETAVKENCKRFEWAVLDWNTPARDFYHNLGAHHKKGWLPYRLEGQQLTDLAQSI